MCVRANVLMCVSHTYVNAEHKHVSTYTRAYIKMQKIVVIYAEFFSGGILAAEFC